MGLFFNSNKVSEKSKVQLENDYKQLILQNQQLINKLNALQQQLNESNKNFSELSKSVTKFCQVILDRKFAQSQIGGFSDISNANVFSLLDLSKKHYKEKMLKQREVLLNLDANIKKVEKENQDLKIQLNQLLNSQQQLGKTPVETENTNQEIQNTNLNTNNSVQSQQIQSQTETMISFNEEEDIIEIPLETMQKKNDIKPFNNTTSQNKNHNTKDNQFNIKNNQNSNNVTKPNNRDYKKTNTDNIKINQTKKNTINSNDNKIKDKPIDIIKPTGTVSNTKVEDNKIQTKELEKINEVSLNITKNDKEDILNNLNNDGKDLKAHIINLNNIIEKINKTMWNIIVAIGVDGLSVVKDIKELVCKRISITESMFNSALQQLRSMDVLEEEKINVGTKWFYVYNLSNLGNSVFIEKFKKNPVLCEKQQLIKDHTTALHGYTIKEVSEILKDKFGYSHVTIDRKTNIIKLPDDKSYIPDVIAKKDDNTINYLEVELGHHTQKDWNVKMDKMLSVTNEIMVVVPSNQILQEKILIQIAEWIKYRGGKESLKGLCTIYLTTTTKLNKKKWEVIYPL